MTRRLLDILCETWDRVISADEALEEIEAMETPMPKREPMTDAEIEKKFEEFSAQYDTLGNEWQDMGANDYFRAGFKAAYDTKGKA